MGCGIDPFQTPGMKTHRREDQVWKTNGQLENFLIRCQVRSNSHDRLNAGIPSPFQGSFEVLDLIQMSMGIDEPEEWIAPLFHAAHYRQPEETGQGIFGFKELWIRRFRRLRRNLAKACIRALINRPGMGYFTIKR